MTRIMITTVHHVTSGSGRAKFQAAWFLLNRGYNCSWRPPFHPLFLFCTLMTKQQLWACTPSNNPHWKCLHNSKENYIIAPSQISTQLSDLVMNSAPSRLGCTHSDIGYSKGCCIKHEHHRLLTYLVFLETHMLPSVTSLQYHKWVPKTWATEEEWFHWSLFGRSHDL
jgi:hypothetical protein